MAATVLSKIVDCGFLVWSKGPNSEKRFQLRYVNLRSTNNDSNMLTM